MTGRVSIIADRDFMRVSFQPEIRGPRAPHLSSVGLLAADSSDLAPDSHTDIPLSFHLGPRGQGLPATAFVPTCRELADLLVSHTLLCSYMRWISLGVILLFIWFPSLRVGRWQFSFPRGFHHRFGFGRFASVYRRANRFLLQCRAVILIILPHSALASSQSFEAFIIPCLMVVDGASPGNSGTELRGSCLKSG